MILSKYVDVKISNNQVKYFSDKGYNVKGGNEIVSIKVSDLPIGSGSKIKAKCDICDKETEVTLNRYHINTKHLTTYYACSRKCSEKKNKNTILEKYGVENVSNSQIIKDKKVETCLSNFGVEYPQQSIDIFYFLVLTTSFILNFLITIGSSRDSTYTSFPSILFT